MLSVFIFLYNRERADMLNFEDRVHPELPEKSEAYFR